MLLSKKTPQLLVLVFKTLYFKHTVMHKEIGKHRANFIPEGGAVPHSVYLDQERVF